MFGAFIAKRFVLRLEPEVFRLVMDAIMLMAGLAMLWNAAFSQDAAPAIGPVYEWRTTDQVNARHVEFAGAARLRHAHSAHLIREIFMSRGIIAAAALAVVVIALVLGSWYTVDQTERAVLLKNGAVVGTAQPGLGFNILVIDSVQKVSVKTATYTWDKMNSYSYDQQPADLKISVTLRASPDKVADLYAKFGTLDTAVNQVVNPVVNQQVKVVFGRYTAVKAIQERGTLNSAIKDAITDTLKYDPILIIEKRGSSRISNFPPIIWIPSSSACSPRSRCSGCSRTPSAKRSRPRSP